MPYSISLRAINFDKVIPKEIQQLCFSIANDPDLELVSFSEIDLSVFNFKAAEPVLAAIKNNRKIQTVILSSSHFENAPIECLDVLFAYLKFKKNFILSRNRLNELGAWFDFVKNLLGSKLETLELFLNHIGHLDNDSIQNIFDVISKSNLQRLLLANNDIGSNNCIRILLSLFKGKMQYLDLSSNQLGCGTQSKEWIELFATLQNNKSLKGLNLSNCGLNILNLTDDDEEENIFAIALLTFIKHTSLQEIDLSKNEFTKCFTIQLIKAAIRNNKNLTLKCEGNGLTKEEICLLKQNKLQEMSHTDDAHNERLSVMPPPLTFSMTIKGIEKRVDSLIASPHP